MRAERGYLGVHVAELFVQRGAADGGRPPVGLDAPPLHRQYVRSYVDARQPVGEALLLQTPMVNPDRMARLFQGAVGVDGPGFAGCIEPGSRVQSRGLARPAPGRMGGIVAAKTIGRAAGQTLSLTRSLMSRTP